jgi:plasmid stabilization system protein ParE
MARVRILLAADADIERVLRHTLRTFGVRKYDDYVALIGEALQALAADPQAGRNRQDIDPAA